MRASANKPRMTRRGWIHDRSDEVLPESQCKREKCKNMTRAENGLCWDCENTVRQMAHKINGKNEWGM